MPKYVNADKIIEHLNDELEGCEDCDLCFKPVTYGTRLGLEYSKSFIETAETADVQEVRHGHWIEKNLDAFRKVECSCSICGWSGVENYDSYVDIHDFEFCPNCGAKMLEDEKNIDKNE